MLQNWNFGLQILSPAVLDPDQARPLALYGSAWAEGDRLPVPEADFPAGLPLWIHENDGSARAKVRTIWQAVNQQYTFPFTAARDTYSYWPRAFGGSEHGQPARLELPPKPDAYLTYASRTQQAHRDC
jgi:hypothetical protein